MEKLLTHLKVGEKFNRLDGDERIVFEKIRDTAQKNAKVTDDGHAPSEMPVGTEIYFPPTTFVNVFAG